MLRLGAEGPELPQQSLRATLQGLGSGSGTLAAYWLQQAVEVDAEIAKVDVGKDPHQCCRRQDSRLGLGRGAKAKGDIFKTMVASAAVLVYKTYINSWMAPIATQLAFSAGFITSTSTMVSGSTTAEFNCVLVGILGKVLHIW